MVNGFFGLALYSKNKIIETDIILENVNQANEINKFSFYENFNTKTIKPNGVAQCAWSAAAAILLHQTRYNNFKILV